MIVVADTSPLNYLLQIDQVHLLHVLYSRLLIPEEVISELTAAGAPAAVRAWGQKLPSWVDVGRTEQIFSAGTVRLDAGESAALQLALERSATTILIDEWKATKVARSLGFRVIGTLGILRDSQRRGLVDGHRAYEKLKEVTNFRDTPLLAREFLESIRKLR